MDEENVEVKKQTKVKKPPTKGKLDISEATVVEETSKESVENSSGTSSDHEYVKNLVDQKTVNLEDASKEKASQKITIDFMNEDHIKNFTGSSTKKADPVSEDSTKSQFDGKSAEDLRKEINQAEKDSTKNFSAKDFEDIAKFIIFLIDTGIASTLKWWSKDSSESAYSLPEKKKDMLVYQLTLILTKYQAKFSIEFMFILTILIVYAPAFIKAKDKKKESKQSQIIETDYKFPNQEQQQNNESVVNAANNVTNKTAEVIQLNKKPTRKRGNPGKA